MPEALAENIPKHRQAPVTVQNNGYLRRCVTTCSK